LATSGLPSSPLSDPIIHPLACIINEMSIITTLSYMSGPCEEMFNPKLDYFLEIKFEYSLLFCLEKTDDSRF